jgi:hypothetical protein
MDISVTDVSSCAMSEVGHGRLWPAGCWHGRSTPSSGNHLAARHLRFVPTTDRSYITSFKFTSDVAQIGRKFDPVLVGRGRYPCPCRSLASMSPFFMIRKITRIALSPPGLFSNTSISIHFSLA